MTIRHWQDRGATKTLLGHEIFFVAEGEGPVIAFLHGYPSSSYDLHLVWEQLTRDHRVIAHDHLGFGFSAKPPNAAYSLSQQADLAVALWTELGVKRLHLVGHDYGQTVAAEIVARREEGKLPFEIDTVTLCNGSTLIDLAEMSRLQKLASHPVFGPVLIRLSNRFIFRRQIRRVLGDNDAVPDREIDEMFELMTRDGGRAVWSKIARYPEDRRRNYDRYVGALERLDIPCHVFWARLDAVAIPKMAEVLHDKIATSTLSWQEEAGHYAMLEHPQQWANILLTFIDQT